MEPPLPPRPPPLPPPTLEPTDAVDDDVVVVAPGAVPPRQEVREHVGWKDGVDGTRARFDLDYVVPATGQHFSPNWQMACRDPLRRRCAKKKHVSKETPDHVGALGFLHAWLDTPAAPGKTHGGTNPDIANGAAFAREHRADLEAVVHRIVDC